MFEFISGLKITIILAAMLGAIIRVLNIESKAETKWR